ncbi:hypothetical protein CP985_14550 [Malaciobacter mytili LMG 24559]|uniref:Calcineurin-like phosphoesterase domain-containing protein n=1 Tax=Malaciobacter mytili LMG 24559 TaxID=1032238 RepID=A0AAX2AB77_9BACT|nr:metallophosphoesterase family protein [Malaciobacter mytili]AXH14476.1 metallophosphoesterase [Malaciobacter mytili LMG 24559]RXK12359.1 hypothetical protein CP985_14550 [Malaciobacter mytili LMG 24559]
MNKKIAIISDIHSNFTSLSLSIAQIKEQKIDLCIILGDLLTYGTMPNEVIDLLLEFQKNYECIFIKGNHDQFYFDLQDKKDYKKYKIASFVEESILWTNEKLKFNLFESFPWQNDFSISNIYFSHANPFEYGNWEYLNDEENIQKAAKTLYDKNMKIGIFGHTHRSKQSIVINELKVCNNFLYNSFKNSDEGILILNSGSIGQPRGTEPSILILSVFDDFIEFDYVKVKVDSKIMINKINNSSLSEDTKNKLNSFWEMKND